MADHEPAVVVHPVAKPRRILHTPTAYENVSLDAINKNIIVPVDNLQTTLKPKVPNNKQFMQSTADDDDGNHNHHHHQRSPTCRSVITDINNLNLAKFDKNSANQHFADSHKLNNMPVPAPRRLANAASPCAQHAADIYENHDEAQQSAQDIYESNEDPPPPSSKSSTTSSSRSGGSPLPESLPQHSPPIAETTGAIRKAHRRPPQLPLPPPPPTTTPPKQLNNQMATKSGVLVDYCADDADGRHRKLEKTVSNGSLSSTTSGGSSSGAKYRTNSPG